MSHNLTVIAYFRTSCKDRAQWRHGLQRRPSDGPRHHFRQSLAVKTRKNTCQNRFATQVAPYDTFSIVRPSWVGYGSPKAARFGKAWAWLRSTQLDNTLKQPHSIGCPASPPTKYVYKRHPVLCNLVNICPLVFINIKVNNSY